ncbi:hypothetical protein RRG08_032284 [Elysia crispata]|uniref:Uncharacterized protein n=1 Tax=Elysia crispata TaxID=231223 RepID=A0AAE1E3H4_9GAST|nr:hypothetical protein RRG08_032284 [Elysia crispata]
MKYSRSLGTDVVPLPEFESQCTFRAVFCDFSFHKLYSASFIIVEFDLRAPLSHVWWAHFILSVGYRRLENRFPCLSSNHFPPYYVSSFEGNIEEPRAFSKPLSQPYAFRFHHVILHLDRSLFLVVTFLYYPRTGLIHGFSVNRPARDRCTRITQLHSSA